MNKSLRTVNKKQLMSWVRSDAKFHGLVLIEKNMTINNQKAFQLVNRKTREIVCDNMTLNSASLYLHYL